MKRSNGRQVNVNDRPKCKSINCTLNYGLNLRSPTPNKTTTHQHHRKISIYRGFLPNRRGQPKMTLTLRKPIIARWKVLVLKGRGKWYRAGASWYKAKVIFLAKTWLFLDGLISLWDISVRGNRLVRLKLHRVGLMSCHPPFQWTSIHPNASRPSLLPCAISACAPTCQTNW